MDEINWDDYHSKEGFLRGSRVTTLPAQAESNSVLFTAHERLLRLKLNSWDVSDQNRLRANLAELTQGDILVRPAPWQADGERIDDHIGLGSTGYSAVIEDVLDYLRGHPWGHHWLYLLFPAMVCHLERALGRPSFWRRVWQALSIATQPMKSSWGDQDPWILNWHLVEGIKDPAWFETWAIKRYWARLRGAWPGGLAQVFTAYWGDPNHPVVQACKELNL